MKDDTKMNAIVSKAVAVHNTNAQPNIQVMKENIEKAAYYLRKASDAFDKIPTTIDDGKEGKIDKFLSLLTKKDREAVVERGAPYCFMNYGWAYFSWWHKIEASMHETLLKRTNNLFGRIDKILGRPMYVKKHNL